MAKFTPTEQREMMERYRTRRWLDKVLASAHAKMDEKHAERITDRADRMQELEERDRIWRERPRSEW